MNGEHTGSMNNVDWSTHRAEQRMARESGQFLSDLLQHGRQGSEQWGLRGGEMVIPDLEHPKSRSSATAQMWGRG